MKVNEFYCVKCKKHTMCHDKHIGMVTLKNKRSALKAKCASCGTKVFKFVKTSDKTKLKTKFGSVKRSESRSKSKKRSKSKSKRRSGRKSRSRK